MLVQGMSIQIPFDNSYSRLPNSFYQKVRPQSFPEPKLISFNQPLSLELNIDVSQADQQELAEAFSGKIPLHGSEPLAMAYAGHQFGHFVPQLGDGRALLIGEVLSKKGQRWDLHWKGSGETPFSRRGDGKAALGPVLREYLVSEAMFAMGVPTTRTLAAVSTGEVVFRETPMPGAVLTRAALCHIRIGTFEYFAARKDIESLRILLNYCVHRFFPKLVGSKELPLKFLQKVMEAQARLIPQWMGLGFIHGVMNTDNMCVIEQTLDYGPCAFMDEFQEGKVFSSIDRQGRYAYNQQPDIAVWNLHALANCLLPLSDEAPADGIASFEKLLSQMPGLLEKNWLQVMSRKFGLQESPELPRNELVNMIRSFLSYLETEKLDFTSSFRALSKPLPMHLSESQALYPRTEEFQKFETEWRRLLAMQGRSEADIISAMNRVNPLYIPRNHLIERSIQAALKDDFSFFHQLLNVLKNPFEEQKGCEEFTEGPKPEEKVERTFCGT